MRFSLSDAKGSSDFPQCSARIVILIFITRLIRCYFIELKRQAQNILFLT